MAQFEDVIIIRNFIAADFTTASVAGRLTNFPTGLSVLRPGHMLWIQQQVVPAILDRPNAWIDLFGYASKRGNTQFNLSLSRNRADAAKNFIDIIMQLHNQLLGARVNINQGFGEDHPDYVAGEDDNAPHWRAVEVLVFGSKPKVVRKPPAPQKENKEFEIRVEAGISGSIVLQADDYIFQIVDLTKRRTAFYQYTGLGLGLSLPKIPGPGSMTFAGPPSKFTTSRPAELHQFNSKAILEQKPGATFGNKSFEGLMRLSIHDIADHKGMIFTNPPFISIEGGPGIQMPGLGSTSQGVLAKITDDFPFTGY